MRKILMIAADFPPCLSAGVQRTLHFAENLLRYDWQPFVLTVNKRAYRALDYNISVSKDITQFTNRAFALDASRHLAIGGKYFDFLEDPDKLASWYYHGWRSGLSMIKTHGLDAIWSTYPVSTAHRIALKLKKLTGLPWIADFRDPLHCHYDAAEKVSRKARTIDSQTLCTADRVIFATDRMRSVYVKAYPDVEKKKFVVIENGYDDTGLKNLETQPSKNKKFTLLHSGHLYDGGRNPEPLFQALSRMKKNAVISGNNFVLRLRGSDCNPGYSHSINQDDIADLVEFLPPVDFSESVKEMRMADALLVFQGQTFDSQIPGKVYEYIAAAKPIFGIIGQSGATADLLRTIPNAHIAPEFDVEETAAVLSHLMKEPGDPPTDIYRYSRRSKAQQLINILHSL